MGIEPTNKGFADHHSNHCKCLILRNLMLCVFHVGPSLGPTHVKGWRTISHPEESRHSPGAAALDWPAIGQSRESFCFPAGRTTILAGAGRVVVAGHPASELPHR